MLREKIKKELFIRSVCQQTKKVMGKEMNKGIQKRKFGYVLELEWLGEKSFAAIVIDVFSNVGLVLFEDEKGILALEEERFISVREDIFEVRKVEEIAGLVEQIKERLTHKRMKGLFAA